MKPKSVAYVSVEVASYLADYKHSIAFHDGYPIFPICSIREDVPAYVLLYQEPCDIIFSITPANIFRVVIAEDR